jgi:sulfoxide reductase heme-binding subunit YedZ
VVLADRRAEPTPHRAKSIFARALKPTVFALCCLPLVKLGADAFRGELTANPISEVLNRFGFWALTWLMVSLAISPAKALFGWTSPMRVRRMIGLFAFFYAALHFATYLGLDQAFALDDIGKDIFKRKFITIGFGAFLLLVPLALTSTDRSVKSLGFRRWKRLHRLVYAAAVLGVVHFLWRVKADKLVPSIFAVTLVLLFAIRVVVAARKKRRPGSRPEKAGAAEIAP